MNNQQRVVAICVVSLLSGCSNMQRKQVANSPEVSVNINNNSTHYTSEVHETKLPDGSVYRVTRVNGVAHGPYEFYFAGGEKCVGSNVNGIPTGRYVVFYANGEKKHSGEFIDGEPVQDTDWNGIFSAVFLGLAGAASNYNPHSNVR
ncbi:MAG: hypothetical protein NTZ16_16295 [Verrucomicrobia bacterium]|nr:hypothetical protein [Verrucomicrobiota bacterium]